jgi:chromosome partitioning protein
VTRVIAACNQKGGVGKTTTCVNTAAAMAAMEKRVLLVDMDPQANSTQGMGLDQTERENDLYDALLWAEEPLPRDRVTALVEKTCMPYLDMLPCSRALSGLEIQLVTGKHRERRLQRVIEPLLADYDFVFIDSPPSLSLLTLNVLTAANSVLIPIQCEYYALQGLAELLNTIRLVQQSFNPSLSIEGALLTMYDSRLNLSKQVAEDVQNTFSEKVFKSIIPRSVKLSEAPSFGKPIILYDVLSLGAMRYMELAKEILAHGTEATPHAADRNTQVTSPAPAQP